MALHAGQLRRPYQRSGHAGRCGELSVEPEHKQKSKSLVQVASKIAARHPKIAQAGDAPVGGRLEQAVLDCEAANAVHNGKYPAFLEVERISRALGRD